MFYEVMNELMNHVKLHYYQKHRYHAYSLVCVFSTKDSAVSLRSNRLEGKIINDKHESPKVPKSSSSSS